MAAHLITSFSIVQIALYPSLTTVVTKHWKIYHTAWKFAPRNMLCVSDILLIWTNAVVNLLVLWVTRFNVHGTVHRLRCILYNQRDATCTVFLIIISVLHVSGGFSAHHQELIKLYVQPWVLSYFSAVYRWCGCVRTTHPHQR
jgi:hypothetical protein